MEMKIVKSVKKKPLLKKVYNLKIKDNHNYFANGILVHNCDDPNDVEEVFSKAKRERALLWFSGKWSTRQNNQDSVSLVVQQRCHEDDISGEILRNDSKNNWTKLILPMEFESKRRCKTIVLPSTKGKIWEDPRKEEKELLNSERFSLERVEILKSKLQTQYNISGQLQQRPTPEEGGIIKKKWFNWWKEEKYPRFLQIIQSWDTALTENKRNAYSACTTWGIFHNEYRIPNLMLIGVWRDHLAYPDLRRIAQKLATDYRDDGKDKNFITSSQYKPSLILIEAKSSGISLIQDFHRAGILCVGFDPDRYGEKESRVNIASQIIEAGRVWVPSIAPHYKQLKPFADMFVEECSLFPMASSRDLVDTMTQVLLRLMNSEWLKNPEDNQFENENSSHQPRVIYGVN
jgi:phage terminase large subunit-like protein